jgi:SAM-dependent methyltransferase
MIRAEIEKVVEPIIQDCLRKFGDYTRPGMSPEEFARATAGELRPDVRRVSLLVSLIQAAGGDRIVGEGLELGCGYGFLLFPMALFNPRVHWTGVEHPDRNYFNRPEFQQAVHEYHSRLVGVNFVRERLPFSDQYFSVITLSETLEHLPIERISFVMEEISRVLASGGLLIASSPNQASLENRIRLLKGRSILELPDRRTVAKDIFGHIRIYTPDEMNRMMSERGFSLERFVLESNNSAYRGKSSQSWLRRLYRLYERVEQHFDFLRSFGDTWYMVFRKN